MLSFQGLAILAARSCITNRETPRLTQESHCAFCLSGLTDIESSNTPIVAASPHPKADLCPWRYNRGQASLRRPVIFELWLVQQRHFGVIATWR